MNVGIGYVVLYMNDTKQAAKFWTETFGFEIKKTVKVGTKQVITVGASNSQTNFELVPLSLMSDNPYNLNLGIPSICLHVDNLQQEHARLTKLGANVSEINDMAGIESMSIIDLEGNAFAIIQR
ncbi:VOC family protein [Mollicutes bacterium LVI A0039]|nr:VOC family protein [Mollicutes bacterium LVI A0039]